MEKYYLNNAEKQYEQKIKRYMNYNRMMQVDSSYENHLYTIDFDTEVNRVMIDSDCLWEEDISYSKEKITEVEKAIAKIGYRVELLEVQMVRNFDAKQGVKKLKYLVKRIDMDERENSKEIEMDFHKRIKDKIKEVKDKFVTQKK